MQPASKELSNGKSPFICWLIWFSTALFYFYEYALRTAPSAMMVDLKAHFALSAAGLGTLVGAYFYAYAPAQVIAGALIDGYGGKKIMPFSVLLCVLGSWLFLSDSVTVAFCGRLLIGLGSGFAYAGILYVASNWIGARQFALVIGLTQAMGLLGAIAGQAMMVHIVVAHGWSAVWNYAIVSGIALTLILALIIPKRPAHIEQHFESQRWARVRRNVKLVFLHAQTWAVSCYGGLFFIPTTVFAMLWGVPFLQLQLHVDLQQATHLTSLVFIGWIVGTPLVGLLASRYMRRKVLMGAGLLCVFILFLMIAYAPLNYNVMRLCLLLIGFFSSTQILTYLVAKESFYEYAKGSAIGVTNFIVFSWTALLTPLLGVIIHYFSSHHVGVETLADYHQAMVVVPVCLLLAGVSLWFARETHGQQAE